MTCIAEALFSVRSQEAVDVPQPTNKNVDRMEFMLALRRRGISDAAVLRAMDEVPREHFVAGIDARRRPMPTTRCRSPAARPSASPMSSPT